MSNSKNVKWGLIGAGVRGSFFAKSVSEMSDNVTLARVYDPSEKSRERLSGMLEKPVRFCSDYQEIIDNPEIEWVMIFSPNKDHAEHCTAALAAGKHVFLEKPPAVTIEECLQIADAQKTSGKMLIPGFVLRYTPIWNKARELVQSGKYGHIISVNACENLRASHGSHIMMGWRRFSDMSGSHILEKCSHSFDLLDWLIESQPSKVASFGNLRLFKPENAHLRETFRDKEGVSPFDGWAKALDDQPCPFMSDKTVIDNQVCILEYGNGVSACYQATLANSLPEKRFYLSCSEGTIIVEYSEHQICCCRYGEEPETFTFNDTDSHGGGDARMCQAVIDQMLAETPDTQEGGCGLYGAITAISLEQARECGTVVDLEPIWQQLSGYSE